MSAAIGAMMVVLGAGLFAAAWILLLVGGRSLVGLKWNPYGGELFIDCVRLLVSGTDDPTKRVAVRQVRIGWALGLSSMLVLFLGLMLLIPA